MPTAEPSAGNWKAVKLLVNIFAQRFYFGPTTYTLCNADQVVADLVERGGRRLAIVAVEFVVVRIISVGIFRENKTLPRARREIAAILLEHDYVEHARERRSTVSPPQCFPDRTRCVCMSEFVESSSPVEVSPKMP